MLLYECVGSVIISIGLSFPWLTRCSKYHRIIGSKWSDSIFKVLSVPWELILVQLG
jgi:hypothetical protein